MKVFREDKSLDQEGIRTSSDKVKINKNNNEKNLY